MMKTTQSEEQTEPRVPAKISDILELDPPFEGDFIPGDFPYVTGEPGLGRNNDIVGAKHSRYVSSSILGRLP